MYLGEGCNTPAVYIPNTNRCNGCDPDSIDRIQDAIDDIWDTLNGVGSFSIESLDGEYTDGHYLRAIR